MWEEIEVGVCQAPASWQGACSPLLHSVDMMSEEKKLNWKIRCAWNFPCAPDSSLGPRDYDAVCQIRSCCDGDCGEALTEY